MAIDKVQDQSLQHLKRKYQAISRSPIALSHPDHCVSQTLVDIFTTQGTIGEKKGQINGEGVGSWYRPQLH